MLIKYLLNSTVTKIVIHLLKGISYIFKIKSNIMQLKGMSTLSLICLFVHYIKNNNALANLYSEWNEFR